MLQDAQDLFSDAQAVTATAVSTNVLDKNHLANVFKDLGTGKDLYVVITCTETAAAAGAATVTFSLESDGASDLSSPTTHLTSGAIGKAALVAGMAPLVFALPRQANYERYLGLRYTVATGPLTAGKFTAALVSEVPSYKAYKANNPSY